MASGKINKFANGNDSGWQKFDSSENNSLPFTGIIYYRKIGNLVEVSSAGITLKENLTTSSSIPLVTLPEGFRPGAVGQSYAGQVGGDAVVIVTYNGVLEFYKSSSVTTWTTAMNIRFQCTYFTYD